MASDFARASPFSYQPSTNSFWCDNHDGSECSDRWAGMKDAPWRAHNHVRCHAPQVKTRKRVVAVGVWLRWSESYVVTERQVRGG